VKSVLGRIPAFQLGRRLGRPLVLPASLTVNVLYACNSRCKTCFIYENRAKVLNVEEYERLFRSVGKAARWVTITGGEPFLRPDLLEIAGSVSRNCRPAVVNIPTNGTFPDRVERVVESMAASVAPGSLIINLSIDEVEHAHDELRRFEGNWELAMQTAGVLKELKRRHPNLVFGINTVVSRFNEHRIHQIAERVEKIAPDSYVAEVAGQRVELGTSRAGITPSTDGVLAAIGVLRARSRRTLRLIEALVASLREEYYHVLERYTLERRQILPCYAGITSAHVMPEGKVWACCVLGEELGDLRQTDYDFPTIWYGAAARAIRERIKRERCACTLSNQSYLNVLVDPRSLLRAGARATKLLAASHAAALVPRSPPWQSASF
jgi:MoaA/NifB/PqqE/SkfB family radical SAM enzyme